MKLNFQLLDPSVGEKKVKIDGSIYSFEYPCSNSSICTPYFAKIPAGFYCFEVWGAQGGISGGKGGYSIGFLKLKKKTLISQ